MAKKFEAYWLNKRGAIIGVPTTHINYMSQNLNKFFLSREKFVAVHEKYVERLGQEGKAREELMIRALKRGWVRVRFTDRNGWMIQAYKLDKSTRENIWEFVKEMLRTRQAGKYADIKIMTLNDSNMITSSFDRILGGEILEIKNKETQQKLNEFIKKYMTYETIYLKDIVKMITLESIIKK